MPNTVASANMSLPVPVVGVDPGPQYALDVNNCLTLVDQHDHSANKGVQVTPAGLNINADLSLHDNNLIASRSLRMQVQPSPLSLGTDLVAFYAVGVDAYFNDGSGNQIRLTQSGGVAGSPGSISNLTSPASASYNAGNQTFVWQSAANTPANMDGASFIFRNLVANSKGLTLQPPAAMGVDYALTLPVLPGSTLPMFLDNTGAMSTGQINTAHIANNAITTPLINNGAVTLPKLAAANIAFTPISNAPCGNSPVLVATLSITSTGRPIMISIIDDGTNGGNSFIFNNAASTSLISLFNNAAPVAVTTFATPGAGSLTSGAVSFMDTPTAGAQVYTLTGQSNSTLTFSNLRLMAYEF